MGEARNHRVICWQRRWRELAKNRRAVLGDGAILLRVVFTMKLEVGNTEPKLTHLNVGSPIGARALHFPEELFGNGLARFVMASEHVKSFAFPAPVLHDLAGKFDEVPCDGSTR